MDEMPAAGIYDVGSSFAAIFDELALGVNDVVSPRLDADEVEDLLEWIAIEAFKVYRSDAQYFARGSARAWAHRVAERRSADRKRNDGRRTVREEVYAREFLEGNRDLSALDQLIEGERDRAIDAAFQVMPPRPRKVGISMLLRGRSRSETAADLGLSERSTRRAYEKAVHLLSLALAEWNPRGSRNSIKRGGDA
jgi:RNA polymerase sigma factor (sigma-70 family)